MNLTTTDRRSVLMIDLDNCPQEILDLESSAARYDLIIASHGSQEPRVPLGIAAVIGQLLTEGRIEIWAMPAGKNSADFGLTFLAGRLSADSHCDTHFEIASRDKDLEHAVDLLRRSGFSARRIDSSTTGWLPSADDPEDARDVSAAAAALAHSLCGNGAKSRPKKKKALISTAQARGTTPPLGLAALEELISLGAIAYDTSGFPAYNSERLKQLARKPTSKRKMKTEPLRIAKLTAKAKPARPNDSSQMRLFD